MLGVNLRRISLLWRQLSELSCLGKISRSPRSEDAEALLQSLPGQDLLCLLVTGVPVSLQSPPEVPQPSPPPDKSVRRPGQSGQQDDLHHRHGGQADDQQGRHQAAAQQAEDQDRGPGPVQALPGCEDRRGGEEGQAGELLQAARPHLLHALGGLQARPAGRGDDQAQVLGQHRTVRPLQVHPGVETLHCGGGQGDLTPVLSSVEYPLLGPVRGMSRAGL